MPARVPPAYPECLPDKERHLVLYFLFLMLLNQKLACQASDRLRLAAAVFLAGKIFGSGQGNVDLLAREMNVDAERTKQLALELFVFVGGEENEDKLTAVRRMFNHSQFSYISSIKLSLKAN